MKVTEWSPAQAASYERTPLRAEQARYLANLEAGGQQRLLDNVAPDPFVAKGRRK